MLYAAHKGVFDLAATEDREVPVVVTDFATAELVKVAANAFLATKISFINAMAEVCEVAGGDVTQLARAIGYDPRIGNRFLQAGVGFGGGCLPKDIRAFQARAQELGAGEALRFLHEVDLINLRRRTRVLQLAAELLGRRSGPAGPDLSGTRIAVLGATFKPNSDDVRDAPALAVAGLLRKAGADVRVYDPEGMENARRAVARPDVRAEHQRGRPRRRPGLRADRVGRLPQRRPGRPRRTGRRPAGDRRPQLPRPGTVDPGRLGVPRAWAAPDPGRTPLAAGLEALSRWPSPMSLFAPDPPTRVEIRASFGHAATVGVHSAGAGGVRWRAFSAPRAAGRSSRPPAARTAGPIRRSGPTHLARHRARRSPRSKARDAGIAREQRQLAAKMQAALFQRDILAHAGEERAQDRPPGRAGCCAAGRAAARRPPTGRRPAHPAAGARPPGAAHAPAAPARRRRRPGRSRPARHPPRRRPRHRPARGSHRRHRPRRTRRGPPAGGVVPRGAEHPARPGRAAARRGRGGLRRARHRSTR